MYAELHSPTCAACQISITEYVRIYKKWYIYKIKMHLVYLVLLPSMVRRKMASPPLIKSLLLALRWVRYAAVP